MHKAALNILSSASNALPPVNGHLPFTLSFCKLVRLSVSDFLRSLPEAKSFVRGASTITAAAFRRQKIPAGTNRRDSLFIHHILLI